MQGRTLAFTSLACGDGTEAIPSAPVPQEKHRRALGREPERIIKLLSYGKLLRETRGLPAHENNHSAPGRR